MRSHDQCNGIISYDIENNPLKDDLLFNSCKNNSLSSEHEVRWDYLSHNGSVKMKISHGRRRIILIP